VQPARIDRHSPSACRRSSATQFCDAVLEKMTGNLEVSTFAAEDTATQHVLVAPAPRQGTGSSLSIGRIRCTHHTYMPVVTEYASLR
jgi:hypothetical protein